MSKKDYYEVLGLSKTATADDIKRAYRKLALEWHPDRHQGSDKEHAETRFKEINEAYQVLSDPQKKSNYDQFGHANFGGGGANPFQQGGNWGPFTYSYSSSQGQSPFSGFDFGDPMDIFEQFFGGVRTPRKPRYTLRVGFMDAAVGTEKTVEIEGKRKTIKIPAGVNTGSKIDFPEFLIVIEVLNSSEFEREGYDVYSQIEIPYSTACLGGSAKVKTVHGEVQIKIRAGTRSGTMMRLKSKGIKQLLRGSAFGDHYVKIVVEVPQKLSREGRSLVNELKKIGL